MAKQSGESRTKLFKNETRIQNTKLENNELISILVESIETAQKKIKREKSKIKHNSKIVNQCSLFLNPSIDW